MASEIVKKTLVHVIFFLYVLCTIYINCLSDANVVWIDGNQRLTISFYLQLNPLLNVTDTYDIFSIQNAQTGSHVTTLWCTNGTIYASLLEYYRDTAQRRHYLIADSICQTGDAHDIHIEYNKLKRTNPIASNLCITIDHGDIQRLIYHNIFAANQTIDPSFVGAYDMLFGSSICNVSISTTNDYLQQYQLNDFEKEYVLTYIPTNVMIHENQFVNDSGFSDLFQFCDYTVPSGYDYSFETEWVQLYLQRVSKGDGQSYGVRKQFPECRDSDHAFWDSDYVNLCDDSTAYLSDIGKKRDIYTKIFECNSFNQVMQDHRWYYTVEQLAIYAGSQYADRVKIIVRDYEQDTVYSVTSKSNTYPILSLRNNRSLSHPLYYTVNETNT
eukprot:197110_1